MPISRGRVFFLSVYLLSRRVSPLYLRARTAHFRALCAHISRRMA